MDTKWTWTWIWAWMGIFLVPRELQRDEMRTEKGVIYAYIRGVFIFSILAWNWMDSCGVLITIYMHYILHSILFFLWPMAQILDFSVLGRVELGIHWDEIN